jgi:hypothetical protein
MTSKATEMHKNAIPTQLCFAWLQVDVKEFSLRSIPYRDADKSLAHSGRKQAKETEDFEFHISYL